MIKALLMLLAIIVFVPVALCIIARFRRDRD
jgi:hypothetical protein